MRTCGMGCEWRDSHLRSVDGCCRQTESTSNSNVPCCRGASSVSAEDKLPPERCNKCSELRKYTPGSGSQSFRRHPTLLPRSSETHLTNLTLRSFRKATGHESLRHEGSVSEGGRALGATAPPERRRVSNTLHDSPLNPRLLLVI